jgi:chemotaxis signal transduction protein
MIQEYCRIKVSPALWIALPVSCVEEVAQLQPQDISPIPSVNPCLLGMTNQRGKLLWVLHFERFLGIQPMPLAKQILAIAIRAHVPNVGTCRLACVVMALEEIITLDSQKFIAVPDQIPQRAKTLLSGLVKLDQKTYGILNVNEVFRLLNPSIALSNEPISSVIKELANISTA